jgi:hypothetical protein
MKLIQLIEQIQQIYPQFGESQIILMLNSAKDELCQQTEVLRDTATFDGEADTIRYYPLTESSTISNEDDVITISEVDLDDKMIERVIGVWETRDESEAS